MKNHKCLRCKERNAYAFNGFLSAWCPKCHKEKFGITHEERKATRVNIPLRLFKNLSK
jgi:predicted  nucleic acid-binding Zn-ribbon protein